MGTGFTINRHLPVIWAVAVSWLFLVCASSLAAAAQGGSEQLISTLLADNEPWLRPSVNKLSYTFRMKHTTRDDLYQIEIRYRAPGHLTVTKNGQTNVHTIDNEYDCNNSAYPPSLLTVLQGITLFGPMQELNLVPDDFQLTVTGEDVVAGRQARMLQLIPTGEPSKGALSRWEDKLKKSATKPRYWYVLAPASQEYQGQVRAVIQAECLFEKGPGWSRIQESLSNDPACLTWDDASTQRRQRRTKTFRAFLLPTDDGQVPFLLEEGPEAAEMLPRVLITEGEDVLCQGLHESLKGILPKPERFLTMRVGCGVWGSWYGYSGGGATEDKVWVDQSAGAILREEGYRNGSLCFTIEYGDYEQIGGGKSAPQHVVVNLLHGEAPWKFDMRFSTHGGKTWLLDELTEYQGEDEVAKAWISDVEVEP